MQFSTSSVTGNVVQFMTQVYSSEGLIAFSRGLNTVILSAGPAHALYFGAYEAAKEALVPWDKSEHKHGSHAAAGVVATVFHDGLVTPFDGKSFYFIHHVSISCKAKNAIIWRFYQSFCNRPRYIQE